MYLYNYDFWVSALSSALEDCRPTRPWLFLSRSNVTPCRFAISVQKMWKIPEHVLQNISKRANLRSIAQWPSSLHYHSQIRRNISDYSRIYCLFCSLLSHSSGWEKRPEWKLSYLKWGRERGRERTSSRLLTECRAWHGAGSQDPEIMTWAKSRSQMLNSLSHPGVLSCQYWNGILNFSLVY